MWGVAALVLTGAVILVLKTGSGVFTFDEIQAKRYELERPGEWAIAIEKEGLNNFHKVSEELYRGAQPTAAGIRQLKEMGIKTIINLRSFSSDEDEIGDVEIGYEHIYMKAWHPEEEEVVKFLKIVTDKTRTPVFVHCQHGADRTGLMCAIYRVAVCGWTRELAAEEMVYGGYGFHRVWKNLTDYLMKLDIEKIKTKIGIEKLESESEQSLQNQSGGFELKGLKLDWARANCRKGMVCLRRC